MPIRYHAHRRHVIHSLESLLYQLHTLSFFLAPSLILLVVRLATQNQIASSKDFEGRRGLAFWYTLVVLINFGGLWTHSASDAGVADTKSVVLDFVGMRHVPSRLQLLLLDGTIIFLQLLLTTIAYETSLALALGEEVEDPLVYKDDEDIFVHNLESGLSQENVPIMSHDATPSSSTSSFIYPPSSSQSRPTPSLRPNHQTNVSPSTLSTPEESSGAPHNRPQPRKEKDKRLRLPPSTPIFDLSFRHIMHRLSSPAPSFPENSNLTAEDDELAALQLPLSNTGVSLARTLSLIARARVRQGQERRRRTGTGSASATTTSSRTVAISGETTESDNGSHRVAGGVSGDVDGMGAITSDHDHQSRRIPGSIGEGDIE